MESKANSKIGGWLVLVGIGICVNPLYLLWTLKNEFQNLFANNALQVISNSSSKYYRPDLVAFIYSGPAINTIMLIASTYLTMTFLTKKTLFPKLYIILAIANCALLILDSIVAYFVLGPEVYQFQYADSSTRNIARAIITLVIWVPYMLMSERVKATFINK